VRPRPHDRFDEEWRKFDEEFDKAKKATLVAGVITFVITLALIGLFAWAVVELVQWVTSK